MHAVVKAQPLAKALKRLSALACGRNIASFLNTAWFTARAGKLTLEVFGPFGLRGEVDLDCSRMEGEGFFGVDLRLLSRVAATLDGEVEIAEEIGQGPMKETVRTVELRSGDFVARFEPKEESWYNPEPFAGLDSVRIPAAVFRDWIARIAYCIAQDDTMEAMACLYLGAAEGGMVHACGLNGHQFAKVEARLPELAELLESFGPLLISLDHLSMLNKGWLSGEALSICLSRRNIRLRTEAGSVTVPNRSWAYPSYLDFCAKAAAGEETVKVYRQSMVNALRRMVFFTNDNSRCAYFDMTKDGLKLTTQECSLSLPASAELIAVGTLTHRIAFPVKDLAEILGHFKGETVAFRMTTAEGPCKITGSAGDEDYMVILMPMKITETAFYEVAEVEAA